MPLQIDIYLQVCTKLVPNKFYDILFFSILTAFPPIYLSIFTGSLIYEHYTRECEFGNFDKIKNKKQKKKNNTKKTQKLLAEFLFK